MENAKLNKEAAQVPHTGIFWVHQGDVIQHSEPIAGQRPVAGYIDSPYDHAQLWHKLQRVTPAFRGKEYYDIPRGRVTYHQPTKQFNLLVNRTVAKNPILLHQIKRKFNLPTLPNDPRGKVVVQTDPHYEAPDSVMDDDFEKDRELVNRVARMVGRNKLI